MRWIIPLLFTSLFLASCGQHNDTQGDTPAMWQKNGDAYTAAGNDFSLSVDAAVGGRITSFQLNGREVLSGPEVNPDMYGSTFWTSPQAVWHWPPPPALDNDPFAVSFDGDAIVLTGKVEEKLSLRFIKRISVDTVKRSASITLTIENAGKDTTGVAPWNVSRVASGALVFFPIGEGEMRAKAQRQVEHQKIGELIWYESKKDTPLEDHMLSIGNAAEGWITTVKNGLLFTKRFDTIAPEQQAEGEGEISLYACNDGSYIEVEVQGAYRMLPPGESFDWNLEWELIAVPDTVAVELGNAALVKMAKQ